MTLDIMYILNTHLKPCDKEISKSAPGNFARQIEAFRTPDHMELTEFMAIDLDLLQNCAQYSVPASRP